MKRYTPVVDYSIGPDPCAAMDEDANGDYVRHDDAMAITSKKHEESEEICNAIIEDVKITNDALLAEMAETIRDMLLAADIKWTERNLGHDWANAVRKAMSMLAKYDAQKGETING